jgi:alkanesulfonate monooxygenase SsuD/methylene tetrahydromethanopterin reductase-like flavin-dependent oxidoreductase (luciferase family)
MQEGARVTHSNQHPEQAVSLNLVSGLRARINIARSSGAVVAAALLEGGGDTL